MAEAPEEGVELFEDGGKGLEEVTPLPRGIELELTPAGGLIALWLTPVPKGTEGDDLTPLGGKIELELIPVGRMTELGMTPVPKGVKDDVTPIGGRIVFELTPVPRGIEREGLTPVPRITEELLTVGAATPFLVVGNGGETLLGPVPRKIGLEGGMVTPVPGPVDRPATTMLVVGTAVMLPGLGYGALVGIAGGVKDREGEATHS